MLLPDAEVSKIADDAVLSPQLAGPSHVKLDSDQTEKSAMETFLCFVDIRRQSLDGQSEVAHIILLKLSEITMNSKEHGNF